MKWFLLLAAAGLGLLARAQSRSYGPTHIWWDAGQGLMLPWQEEYDDIDGQVQVLNKNGAVPTKDHPFFEALGSNGRACVTCHQPSNAMSVSAAAIRGRWDETGGRDPIFAAVDGSNCPDLPQSEAGSHSLLLDRGLFRIALPVHSKHAEFRIEVVRDPTGCNTSPRYGLSSPRREISVFRRPRVAANLATLVKGPDGAVLMADGREPTLQSQAITAALVHEEAAAAPGPDALRRILDFETQVYAAQSSDIRGGLLDEKDGPMLLGPTHLSEGAARTLAGSPQSRGFVSFAAWTPPAGDHPGVQREFRASVARGSSLFASREFRVNGTTRTCASCHAEGTTRWMDIGTANRASAREITELPLFKVTCQSTGRIVYTQDPGRALVSGTCEDLGSIVMPQFRGLAARAPYFSDGSAATLREVVDHYVRRYHVEFTEAEMTDLLNFLRVL